MYCIVFIYIWKYVTQKPISNIKKYIFLSYDSLMSAFSYINITDINVPTFL